MSDLILTEKRNPDTVNIDLVSSREVVELINKEDLKVAEAINKELEEISKAVDMISESFLNGGSLLYFGAGTSGRLGVLDASECPPTFGVSPDMVRGYIAGGDIALRTAVEGAEDRAEDGINDLINSGAKQGDIIVGLSASGNAEYVFAVLKKAKELRMQTIGVVCNKKARIKDVSDIFIAPEVGEEAITGSTRMKSGTAQKMVLNMLTSASMIKIGKTYENYMIDVMPTNKKLKDRAARIISEIANVDYNTAQETLAKANNKVKTTIVMLKTGLDTEQSTKLLNLHKGKLRETLKNN